MAELLSTEALAPLVRGTMFERHVHHQASVGSTNTLALEAGARGEPEGSVFLADEQTAGRGRGGHDWLSLPDAGIYCSVLLRPNVPPANVLLLSLAAGLAVAGAVTTVVSVTPDLRWPNDVLLNGKKFCGILAEMNAEATRVHHIALGIGVNVNHTGFPPELREAATSLRIETGREWSRLELVGALLKSLDREYHNVLRKPAIELIARFEAASSIARGVRVRVDDAGGPPYDGVTEGLDPRGFLRVRTSEGVRTVLSGGVRRVS
jgi:BirA family biotin operon repressor/biotin-[acetyl-CoA-carboxylase] ligase